MKESDLKEAQAIVERLSSIDKALAREMANRTQQITVKDGTSETYIPLSPEVATKALEMQKALLRQRRAELVRRANHLGLILEGTRT